MDLNAIISEAAEKREELHRRGVPAWKTETVRVLVNWGGIKGAKIKGFN